MTLARLLKFLIGVVLFCAALWLMIWWQLGWPALALVGTVAILFVHAPLLALEFMLVRVHGVCGGPQHRPAYECRASPEIALVSC